MNKFKFVFLIFFNFIIFSTAEIYFQKKLFAGDMLYSDKLAWCSDYVDYPIHSNSYYQYKKELDYCIDNAEELKNEVYSLRQMMINKEEEKRLKEKRIIEEIESNPMDLFQ